MTTIRRLDPGDVDALIEAGRGERLFDQIIPAEGARAFLDAPGHHVLIAHEGDEPVGFVTGVELTHPDKGTEMFLYELAVDPTFRRQGIGTALVAALRDLAADRGCYGMWVLTDSHDAGAIATYRDAGAGRQSQAVMLEWDLAGDRPAGTPRESSGGPAPARIAP